MSHDLEKLSISNDPYIWSLHNQIETNLDDANGYAEAAKATENTQLTSLSSTGLRRSANCNKASVRSTVNRTMTAACSQLLIVGV